MTDRSKMMPIKVTKAHCTAYGAGPLAFCWSAGNPYYSGHYRTKKEAVAAAEKTRKELARKWGARC